MFGILKFFTKTTNPTIPAADIAIIQRFAEGDESARFDAIRVYRDNLLVPGAKRNPHMQFMREIDNPFREPILIDQARTRLVAKAA